MESKRMMFVVVLLALVSASAALKCYHCTNCEEQSAVAATCLFGMDMCTKNEQSGVVMKSCVPKALCTLDLKGLTDLSEMFGGGAGGAGAEMNAAAQAELDKVKEKIHCCDTDYCNAASARLMNPLLMLMPLALYFFRC